MLDSAKRQGTFVQSSTYPRSEPSLQRSTHFTSRIMWSRRRTDRRTTCTFWTLQKVTPAVAAKYLGSFCKKRWLETAQVQWPFFLTESVKKTRNFYWSFSWARKAKSNGTRKMLDLSILLQNSLRLQKS